MDFLARYPEVVSILIVLSGFVAATFIARWSGKGLRLGEGMIRRLSPMRMGQLSTDRTYTLVQRVVYYLTLSFFLLLALRVLSVGGLSLWLDELLSFIPQIIVGGFIILIGWLLGLITYGLVSSVVQSAQHQLLPRLAQIIVVVTAVMTGLEQMDIDISFIANIVVILIGTFLGGMALAFAMGSRQLVANLLGRRDLDRYSIGDRVKIDTTEGIIMELTATAVVLDTDEGIVTVPASRFAETRVVRVQTGASNEHG